MWNARRKFHEVAKILKNVLKTDSSHQFELMIYVCLYKTKQAFSSGSSLATV